MRRWSASAGIAVPGPEGTTQEMTLGKVPVSPSTRGGAPRCAGSRRDHPVLEIGCVEREDHVGVGRGAASPAGSQIESRQEIADQIEPGGSFVAGPGNGAGGGGGGGAGGHLGVGLAGCLPLLGAQGIKGT